MNKPLLSILIPTKDRYEYLRSLLQAVLKVDRTDFEVVIQDNSERTDEGDAFRYHITDLDDSRVIYEYKEGWMSVIDNCDLSVEKANGEYVCMLGDDDGLLLERTLDFIAFMDKHKIDAAWLNLISYSWPDNSHAVWGNTNSGKYAHTDYLYSIDKLNAKTELNKILREGAAYGLGKLPRLYHGIVRKTVLDKLKAETNSYFPGPSPDMANAVGISKYIDDYIYVDFPLLISGHSFKSTGGQGGRKEHHGNIEAIGHLPKDTATKWSSKIPFFWSGATIYSESARRALFATKQEDSINYEYLLSTCFVYERSYFNEIWKTLKVLTKSSNGVVVGSKMVFYLMIIVTRRGLNFLSNIIKNKVKTKSDNEAINIEEAIDKLDQKFEEQDRYLLKLEL